MEPGRWIAGYAALLSVGVLLGGTPPAGPQSESDDALRQAPRVLAPEESGIGRLVPDFRIAAVSGQAVQLADLERTVVVAFTGTSCPLCRKFAPTLARWEQAYADRNVQFVYVFPTLGESDEEVSAAITRHGFRGPSVRDEEGTIARALGATHSTDVFVLDERRTLIYRGAVDDQYGLGYALEAPRREYLAEALEAACRGERPETTATAAPGCALQLRRDEAPPGPDTPTFHNRISRLLQTHCVECHRHGGVAPFALESAEEVLAHAPAIQQVVTARRMPPWFAAPPTGDAASPWSNDRTLPTRDRADLLAWLAAGCPPGDPREAPLPRRFASDWKIGAPDLIVELPKPISVKASGTMPWQEVLVETGLTSEKWVRAIEIQPTAREVVHHALVFIEAAAEAPAARASDHVQVDQSRSIVERGFFAAYMPGNSTIELPEGCAKLISAGARLRIQIHYVPNGTATTDQTRIGLVFAREPPQHVIRVKGVIDSRLSIPPGARRHEEAGFLRVATDMRVTAFLPHMHLRGTAFRYEALLPGGERRVLLDVPHYDCNWQLLYRLKEPIDLPRGTLIRATGWFDNSRENPANPDPGATVRWGERAEDEMLVGYVEYYQNRPRAGVSGGRASAPKAGSGKQRRMPDKP